METPRWLSLLPQLALAFCPQPPAPQGHSGGEQRHGAQLCPKSYGVVQDVYRSIIGSVLRYYIYFYFKLYFIIIFVILVFVIIVFIIFIGPLYIYYTYIHTHIHIYKYFIGPPLLLWELNTCCRGDTGPQRQGSRVQRVFYDMKAILVISPRKP